MAEKKPTGENKKNNTVNKKSTNNKTIDRDKSNEDIKLKQSKLLTHTGEHLTILQAKFIDKYIEIGVGRQAVIEAGYSEKNADWQANALLRIPKILDEVNWRMEQSKRESIAKSEEIMEYFTKVMRGEEKDQFGLDAPLGERTKAAQELAKRLIDIPNKLEANMQKAGMTGQATVTIALNWDGMEDTTNEGEEDQKKE